MFTRKTVVTTTTQEGVVVSEETSERRLFTFDELDERAQQRAYEKWASLQASDPDCLEFAVDTCIEALAMLGVVFKTRSVKLYGGGTRGKPCVWYSISSSQGDGASWEGDYKYSPGAHLRIAKEFPTDERLNRLARALMGLQKEHGYRLAAKVTQSGRYAHSGAMCIDVYNYYNGEDLECDELVDLLRESADWVYRQLEREIEWLQSRECFDDSRSNDELYDEDGDLA